MSSHIKKREQGILLRPWKPSCDQLPNLRWHSCWSKGKYSMSISHDDEKMAGGDHLTRPSWWMIAFVIVRIMKSPSALQSERELDKRIKG